MMKLIVFIIMASMTLAKVQVTMVPPFRVASTVHPEIRVLYPCQNTLQISQLSIIVQVAKQSISLLEKPLSCSENVQIFPFSVLPAVISPNKKIIQARIIARLENTTLLDTQYEIVNQKNIISTQLIDGCWIDFYHFSEQEGKRFNAQLLNMTNQDWEDQIRYMSYLGVKTAIMQNVFFNDEYVLHDKGQTCTNYSAQAFYPSKLFPRRFPFKDQHDKISAILKAADQYGVNVFFGVGLYAWFDYRNESLCWHKKIMKELYDMYGTHPSFYGWYISEEMGGDFWKDSAPQFYYPQVVDDMVTFFSTIKQFTTTLDPLKPVMLACNSYNWDKNADSWAKIIKYVDILSPFAMTRKDPHWHTLPTIIKTCNQTGTRLWVDMELFSEEWLINTGMLVPKNSKQLFSELQNDWNNVEQIMGYEFTGLFDNPQSSKHLGGDDAKKAYEDYYNYYQSLLRN